MRIWKMVGGSGFGLCRRRTGAQEHIGELRIKDVEWQEQPITVVPNDYQE